MEDGRCAVPVRALTSAATGGEDSSRGRSHHLKKSSDLESRKSESADSLRRLEGSAGNGGPSRIGDERPACPRSDEARLRARGRKRSREAENQFEFSYAGIVKQRVRQRRGNPQKV